MKRRWLRFSVRSLLVLITLCGLMLGTYVIFIRSRLEAYHREHTLRSLDLLHTHVHDSDTGSLHQLKLHRLQLVTSRFGANEAKWIKDLDELKQLVLAAPVADADLATLASLPNLEELIIHSNAVTDAGLVHIARFQNLRSLVLHCPVSDSGMEHLIPLAKLERLECHPDLKGANLVGKLVMPVRAKYQETRLMDALDAMSRITKLAMQIDEAALRAASLSASNVKLTVDEKGDLRQTFDAMLSPHGLACVGESGGLLITTKEEAAKRCPGLTLLLEANPKLEAYVPW